ncbi:MAG: DinB family protein [Pseudomonadota bacterium]
MKPELYIDLAAYNLWMNGKLYDVCATIPDADRKADRGAFFSSIHSTLNHILFGDRAWMKRFTGKAYPLKPIGEDLFEEFDALAAARREMDGEIADWAGALTSDWLSSQITWTSGVDGQTRVQPAWLLASHMFNHQTHHRGQIATLLAQMGLDLGSTDLPWTPALAGPRGV